MDLPGLKEAFRRQVYPSHPTDWEMDDFLGDIAHLKEEHQQLLLQTVPTVWPISHSLCVSFLHEGARHVELLDSPRMAEWLRRILENYEDGGLLRARAYMAELGLEFIDGIHKRKAAVFAQFQERLRSYAKGISRLNLDLQVSERTFTDTERIYIPEKIVVFSTLEHNLLLYRFLICLQSAFVQLGTFSWLLVSGEKGWSTSFVNSVNPPMAKDIYQLLELARVIRYIQGEYPGLMRDTLVLRQKLIRRRPPADNHKNRMMEKLLATVLLPEAVHRQADISIVANLPDLQSPWQSCQQVEVVCRWLNTSEDVYTPLSLLPLMDPFELDEVRKTTEKRIERERKKFETLLADFLLMDKGGSAAMENEDITLTESTDRVKIQLPLAIAQGDKAKHAAVISIDNKPLDLPEELTSLISSIQADLGTLPEAYVAAAFGLTGMGRQGGESGEVSEEVNPEPFLAYDEWDYRRQGYRKGWCNLRQRIITGVRSDFVARTLITYRGTLKKIHRQFEMMRSAERFARRQRHGDDIDLEALIDSLGNQRAGLAPSEKVFVRLLRDQRSITTLFLVDMSSSTEGWIGVAIKEALVLLCEAMERVGDQYGIYGFSGMRRSRSEIYQIKAMDERYGDEIKARIGSISAREYTRMGPPIRHMITHFATCNTRTRLLVILSDGKPEDYDDYKGQYAIEDTRKALAEAKGMGIHTFCITIDREAHDYLDHLFGRGNSMFLQNVRLLPVHLAEMYRLLTR